MTYLSCSTDSRYLGGIIERTNQSATHLIQKNGSYIIYFIGVVLFFNLIQGCAVNNIGLVKVRHFENKTVHMVNLKTIGGFISTNEADAGLTFGFTERTYFYPKDINFTEVDPTSVLIQADEDHLIELEKDEAILDYSDKPIAWISDTIGLTFNTNRHRVGFSLGIAKNQAIRLHRDFDGVFIFKHISGEETKVYYNQNKPSQ